MAEELRFFLRTLIYIAGAAVVYWVVSDEPAGLVLLGGLATAVAAFIAVVLLFVRRGVLDPGAPRGGPIATVNRVVGFADPATDEAPLEHHPDVVPARSPWPVVAAAAAVVIGLGLIVGPWLTVPGIVLLAFGCVGWLTQLDRAR